jgi:hypothetical protein
MLLPLLLLPVVRPVASSQTPRAFPVVHGETTAPTQALPTSCQPALAPADSTMRWHLPTVPCVPEPSTSGAERIQQQQQACAAKAIATGSAEDAAACDAADLGDAHVQPSAG